jgi:hypothetical protein
MSKNITFGVMREVIDPPEFPKVGQCLRRGLLKAEEIKDGIPKSQPGTRTKSLRLAIGFYSLFPVRLALFYSLVLLVPYSLTTCLGLLRSDAIRDYPSICQNFLAIFYLQLWPMAAGAWLASSAICPQS